MAASEKGRAKSAVGRLEKAAGDALDDPELRLRGEMHELNGQLETAVGEAQERINAAAEQMRAAIARATVQASRAYGAVRERAQDVADTVDPFVQDRPYAALVLGALAGFVLGALCYGGRRVIYVKAPRD